jgi:hypothetical protein
MSGYIGPLPVPQGIQEKQTFTATAGQTTFNTNGYTDGAFINVFLNGVRLVNGTDYTATNGSDVVLTSGANAGDVLDFETINDVQLVSNTSTTPIFKTSATLKNDTEEDTDGGRESTLIFQGEQSGGEISTLAEIEASHDGTADDEKGDLIFRTNDGSDGASPTERMRIDSQGDVGIGRTDPITKLHLMHNTSGEDVVLRIQNANASSGAEATLNLTASGNNFSIINYPDADTGNANRTTFKSTAGSSFFTFETAGSEVMRIDSSGNVGIGETSPDTDLHIKSATPIIKLEDSDTSSYSQISASSGDGNLFIMADEGNNSASSGIRFHVDGSHVGRWDDSGNLLVGKTTSSGATAGVEFRPAGLGIFTRDGDYPVQIRRLTTQGDHIRFYLGNSEVGDIGVNSSNLYISGGGAGLQFRTSDIIPTNGSGTPVDNTEDLGDGSYRFDDIFATNGTIQTSDEREKQQIASLTDAEITAAKAISKLFKTFKWNDKVEAKGDAARTHTGVIAQQVETAMSDAGLDAGDYAFFISTTWWETQTEVAAVEADEENGIEAQDAYTRTDTYDTQEEAPEGATERNRKGIRYPELLSFIGAATEQRLTSIEARLDALEAE